MQRRYALLFALLVLCACNLSTFFSPPVPEFAPGAAVTFTGRVIENDLGCTVDGACVLMIDTGRQVVEVIYHYGEYPPCTNTIGVEAAFELVAGDRVEVFTMATSTTTLSTCDDVVYTIRKLD